MERGRLVEVRFRWLRRLMYPRSDMFRGYSERVEVVDMFLVCLPVCLVSWGFESCG